MEEQQDQKRTNDNKYFITNTNSKQFSQAFAF